MLINWKPFKKKPLQNNETSLQILFYKRSLNLTRTSYVIGGSHINLDFIILASDNGQWTEFFQRVPWNTLIQPPTNLLRIDLDSQGALIFRRCPPFFLEQDPCSTWLEWIILEPPITSRAIKVLRIKSGRNPANIRNSTSICTHINYELYVSQIQPETRCPVPAPTRIRLCRQS